jgi:hypothetical protein
MDGEGGYGVRGFITDPNGGIGVLGQAGISGGTGAGARGENVNAASSGNGVEGVTNGSGAGVMGQAPAAARWRVQDVAGTRSAHAAFSAASR